MKRVFLIINPISGKSVKRHILNGIVSNLDIKKYDVTIRFTSYPGHATDIAEEAVKDGADIVVAVGGDGTVNEVASALVATNAALGIIPCGSGNGLARHLGISMNIRKAVDIINKGEIERIDTMLVNGRACFCTAGVGYDAQVSAEYSTARRRGLKTYIKKAITGWYKYEPQEYIIETDSQILKRKAFVITCANANQWGNEFHVAPRASLKDGLIDVAIIRPIRFVNALAMPFQILGYSFDKNPDVEILKATTVSIKRLQANWYHIDGEVIWGEHNINVVMQPLSLKIVK